MPTYIELDKNGSIPGSSPVGTVILSVNNGQLILTDNNQNSNQSTYTEVVRALYPSASLTENWGNYTINYIKQKSGYNSYEMLYALGICSDDVDAFTVNGNLGQYPMAMNSFLGPFMAGGLAGYPFVGSVGFGAFASHVATTLGGTLFVTSMPHIGVTEDGRSGRMLRRGKANSLTDNTCGAVAGAIDQVVNQLSSPPDQNNAPFNNENYSFWKLTDILWPYKNVLSGFTGTSEEIYNNQMIFATETIRDSAYDYIIANLPAATTGNTTNDVYFLSGIFINSDVSSGTTQFESYVVVDKVMKYEYGIGWSNITVNYMSGLPID